MNFSELSNKQLKNYIKQNIKTANSRIRRLKKTDTYQYNRPVQLKWNMILTDTKYGTKKGYFSTGQKTRVELLQQAQNLRNFLSGATNVSDTKLDLERQAERLNTTTDNLGTIYRIYNQIHPALMALDSNTVLNIISERVNDEQNADDIINGVYDLIQQGINDNANFLREWSENGKFI